MTPAPTRSSTPPPGCLAVAVIRWMICAGVRSGNRCRSRAARPDTYAAANEVPAMGTGPSRPCSAFTGSPVSPSATMFSAGAATSTHGPCIENELGIPVWPIPPTLNTSGAYHAGVTTVCTLFQPRGSPGVDGSGAGFCTQSPPVLPAATTTTTPLTLTA
ncbi:Uncharacterised protein [Mycobacterium tuberculosis]|nr:Uncharacterised protein [Mycobacterium tuberculosis]